MNEFTHSNPSEFILGAFIWLSLIICGLGFSGMVMEAVGPHKMQPRAFLVFIIGAAGLLVSVRWMLRVYY